MIVVYRCPLTHECRLTSYRALHSPASFPRHRQLHRRCSDRIEPPRQSIVAVGCDAEAVEHSGKMAVTYCDESLRIAGSGARNCVESGDGVAAAGRLADGTAPTVRALFLLVFEPLLDQRRQLVDDASGLGERPLLRGAKFFKPGAPARLTLVLKVDDGHDFLSRPVGAFCSGWRCTVPKGSDGARPTSLASASGPRSSRTSAGACSLACRGLHPSFGGRGSWARQYRRGLTRLTAVSQSPSCRRNPAECQRNAPFPQEAHPASRDAPIAGAHLRDLPESRALVARDSAHPAARSRRPLPVVASYPVWHLPHAIPSLRCVPCCPVPGCCAWQVPHAACVPSTFVRRSSRGAKRTDGRAAPAGRGVFELPRDLLQALPRRADAEQRDGQRSGHQDDGGDGKTPPNPMREKV